MARRPANRFATLDRPRIKGWWGSPDGEETPEALDTEDPEPEREHVRRPHAPRQYRPIAAVGRSLTPSQVAAIRAIMHLFVEDDLAHGVDSRSVLLCNRCEAPRRAIGSVRYERLTLCNDCSIEYEIARARGLVDGAAEFVERTSARAASA